MNILATQFTLSLKSLDIYVAGCKGDPIKGHCKNCHNEESWCFNQGSPYDNEFKEKIIKKIKSFDNIIKNIMIFGGEPLDQDEKDLCILLDFLNSFNKDIWIFTRFPIDEVPRIIKDKISYLKCGAYIEELKTEDNIQYGIKLATSNQHIYKKGVDF